MKGVIGPVMLQTKAAHDALNESGCGNGTVQIPIDHEFGGRNAVGLDIIGFKSESLKSEKIVNGLPDNAGEREFRDDSHDDDFRLRINVHFQGITTKIA